MASKIFTTMSDGNDDYTAKDAVARSDISQLSNRVSGLVVSDLADTVISNPRDKQSLVYNEASGEWINANGTAYEWVGTTKELREALIAGTIEDGTNILVTDDFDGGDSETILSVIVRDFDPEREFKVGDFVNYDGDIYICTERHTPSIWNIDHFRIALLGDEISKLYQPLQNTVVLSSSSSVSTTFTSNRIRTNSDIDVSMDVYGVCVSDISVSDGLCTITFPPNSTVSTLNVRIYIK